MGTRSSRTHRGIVSRRNRMNVPQKAIGAFNANLTAQSEKAASPGRRLRDAWNANTIAIPGVFNALAAKMAEEIGFQAVYLSGGALSAGNGVPDVGLLTVTEFTQEAQRISSATSLPVLSD